MSLLVKQRHGYDCLVACTAMSAGVSYDEIIDQLCAPALRYLAKGEGVYLKYSFATLWALGFDVYGEDVNGWEPDCDNAILTVPSLNQEGRKHVVFWNGKDVLDPAKGDCYKTADALKQCSYVMRVTVENN